jgi:hypothetical protein
MHCAGFLVKLTFEVRNRNRFPSVKLRVSSFQIERISDFISVHVILRHLIKTRVNGLHAVFWA